MRTEEEIRKEVELIEGFKLKYCSCLNDYTLGSLDGKRHILEWVLSDED